MIELVEHSNLLDVKRGIICHQVNCVGAMGAGLALQIRNKWPMVYDKYVEDCRPFKSCPQRLLGHVQDIMVSDDLIVANCFGQVRPSRCGAMTDFRSWDVILGKMKDLANYFDLDLHLPYLVGCGLAGGDWNVMRNKIGNVFGDCQTKLFIHSLR